MTPGLTQPEARLCMLLLESRLLLLRLRMLAARKINK
jgi:hypothetical protein